MLYLLSTLRLVYVALLLLLLNLYVVLLLSGTLREGLIALKLLLL